MATLPNYIRCCLQNCEKCKMLDDLDRRLLEILALQLHIYLWSESMGLHDSEVMDDRCINRNYA